MTDGHHQPPALATAQAAEPTAGRPAAVPECPAAGSPRPLLGRTGRTLALLFPQAPVRSRSLIATGLMVLANLAAIALGAVVQLNRQPGVPAWQTIWAEDHSTFLPQALSSPWRTLMQPYDGYIELLPRFIAQLVARYPLVDAATGFAIAGALVSSCTAVFVFHACSGHVRRPELRILLAVSVLLLPTALVEIANSGVNTPWYLLYGVFWALLWRPRSWFGMAMAALLCFAAASSNVLAVVYAPMVLARIIALPRFRQHMATLGWLAGGAVQVHAVLTTSAYSRPTTLGRALAFFGHNVILPVVAGHHGAHLLWKGLGLSAATVLAVCVFAAVVLLMLIVGGSHVRAFVVTALVIGLTLCLVPVLIHGDVANILPHVDDLFVKGSRYGQAPILIIGSCLIVSVDAFVRRTGIRYERTAHVAVIAALVAVLGLTWGFDYRYPNDRSTAQPWTRTVVKMTVHCQRYPVMGSAWPLGMLPCPLLLQLLDVPPEPLSHARHHRPSARHHHRARHPARHRARHPVRHGKQLVGPPDVVTAGPMGGMRYVAINSPRVPLRSGAKGSKQALVSYAAIISRNARFVLRRPEVVGVPDLTCAWGLEGDVVLAGDGDHRSWAVLPRDGVRA
jgi:hypothetical protein